MTHQEIIELLQKNGFTDGWTVEGDELLGWEHDENPPAPLKRPTNE